MRLRLLFCFVLSATTLPLLAHSQPVWRRLGSVNFKDIHRFDNGRILICTDAGTIYQSVDDGLTWRDSLINPLRIFGCMSFIGDSGIIGASYGNVELTTDEGASWVERKSCFRSAIGSIALASGGVAVACAATGGLGRSTDYGNTWDTVITEHTAVFRKVQFVSSRHAFVCGDSGLVLETTDAGSHWSPLTTGQTARIYTMDVHPNGQMALGLANSAIMLSRDFGRHWIVHDFSDGGTNDSLSGTFCLVSMTGGDTVLGFEATNLFRFFSTDFGITWHTVRLNPNYQVEPYNTTYHNALVIRPDGTGLLVGEMGTLLNLSNDGLSAGIAAHWAIDNRNLYNLRMWIHARNDDTQSLTGVCESDYFATTPDLGLTWHSRNIPSARFKKYIEVLLSDSTRATTISNGRSKIDTIGGYYGNFRTTDGGSSWSTLPEVPKDNLANGVFDASGVFYAFGDSTVYRTTDQGERWNQYGQPYFETETQSPDEVLHDNRLICGFVQSSDTMWLFPTVIDSNKMATGVADLFRNRSSCVFTSDGGNHWEVRSRFPLNISAGRPVFLNDMHGYVISDSLSRNGRCLQTTDGGYTWNPVPGLTTPRLFSDLRFRNPNDGILLSIDGTIFYTTNGGNTWTEDSLTYIGGKRALSTASIAYFGDQGVFITSSVGLWYRIPYPTQSSGINFNTAQPYLYITLNPTPVTGSAAVHCGLYGLYAVSDRNSINVSLFDVLGRRLRDLSDQARAASNGSFANFDIPTSGLSDGVYLLRLETASGSRTQAFVISR